MITAPNEENEATPAEEMVTEIGDFLAPDTPTVEDSDDDDKFFGRDEESVEDPAPPIEPEAPAVDDETPPVEGVETSETPEATEMPEVPGVPETPETPETPAGDPALATLQEQNALLLAQIEKLTAASLNPPTAAPESPEVPVQPAITPAVTPPTDGVYDFVGDGDLDEILSSKDLFNSLISKAINTAVNHSQEGMLRAMPQVVQAQVKQQNAMQEYVNDFYKENDDLVGVKQTVGAVTNSVYSEHPDWNIEQVFEETALRTRNMLGLAAKAKGEAPPSNSPETPRGKKPALPGVPRGGSRNAGTPLTVQQKHMNDVL